jgi:hypothetical protein
MMKRRTLSWPEVAVLLAMALMIAVPGLVAYLRFMA